ncbi:hypothetical protein Taro_010107 [Colocasia esculenta]|uniref:Uncharacterized protein n=1 Tax=Colocasia esculenta TaxID=4460 RepID=A0A843U8K0_COLES|nr:hypothetical protein [Colocasia esculenta]
MFCLGDAQPAIFQSLLYKTTSPALAPLVSFGPEIGSFARLPSMPSSRVTASCRFPPEQPPTTPCAHSTRPWYPPTISAISPRTTLPIPQPPTFPGVPIAATSHAANDLHRINKASRNCFKRSAIHTTGISGRSAWHEPRPGSLEPEAAGCPRSSPVCDNLHWRQCYAMETLQATSHESFACQASELYSDRGLLLSLALPPPPLLSSFTNEACSPRGTPRVRGPPWLSLSAVREQTSLTTTAFSDDGR